MIKNISEAISYQPAIKEGSYFLCPDTFGDSGGLHLHIDNIIRNQCDIKFGAPTSSAIRFDKDAATRMAAFMTELAKVL
jgi:hypothetical protein